MAVTIEVDGKQNQSLYFRPIQAKVRGRFDFSREADPQGKLAGSDWPVVPGQRITLSGTTGVVEETLLDAEHAVAAEKVQAKGFKVPPSQTFENVSSDTWAFWMQRAVDAGHARLVEGKFPKIDESKVRRNFLTVETPSTTDRLTAALERQNELFEALLTKLAG